jgi:16S rRNA (guanine527-N7)-methyltransferase
MSHVTAIRSGLDGLGLGLSDSQLALLDAFVGLLAKWNKAYNLTAVRDPAQMVSLHILDSLAIAPHIAGASLLDVGTGPGLPGIPLAIAQPERQFTLLDSNVKKTRFVQQAVLELGLPNVEVVHARVEEFKALQGFDTVTARAFAPLARMLPQIEAHIAQNGCVLAMKSQRADQELEQAPAGWCLTETIELDVPGVEGTRCALRLVKAAVETA